MISQSEEEELRWVQNAMDQWNHRNALEDALRARRRRNWENFKVWFWFTAAVVTFLGFAVWTIMRWPF